MESGTLDMSVRTGVEHWVELPRISLHCIRATRLLVTPYFKNRLMNLLVRSRVQPLDLVAMHILHFNLR
jgi:hypothetical protein